MTTNMMVTSVASSSVDTRPWKIVTHKHPDTDAYACIWAALRFVVKEDECELAFVRAGEALPDYEAEGFRVLQMDTGKGELDQHQKELKRSSSFALFVKKYGLGNDAGIKEVLELTLKADNIEVEVIDYTSIHYVFRGLPFHYRDRQTKEVDWNAACQVAFLCLDIVYSQAVERAHNLEEYQKVVKPEILPNGLKMAALWFRPALRQAAFDNDNDVIVFFNKKKDTNQQDRFYVVIQKKKQEKDTFRLDSVLFALRQAEAKKRGVDIRGIDLWAFGEIPILGAWFLHDSHNMIGCGTNGHELIKPEEFTVLSPGAVLRIVSENLGKLSPMKT